MSEFELGNYNPKSGFGRKIKQIVDRGDNSDATIYWLANRVEELEKDIENYKKACASWETVESYSRKEAQRYRQSLKRIRLACNFPDEDKEEIVPTIYEEVNKALKEESQ